MQTMERRRTASGLVLSHLSLTEIDALPFGVIHVDMTGKVLAYNQTEASLAGRDSDQVRGRNFFRDIAPCTRHPGFLGRFLEIRDGRRRMASFDYVFDHGMNARKVHIEMERSKTSRTIWIGLTWLGAAQEADVAAIRPEIDRAERDELMRDLGVAPKEDAEEFLI